MNKIQIRRKVKKHIKSKGANCDFDVTPTFINFWWHEMNKAIFDGELIYPTKFHIRNFRDDSSGWCIAKPKGEELGFLRKYDNRKQFLTVLVHEMVHQYQNQTTGIMTHGKSFYYWENTINQSIGLPLGEYID